MAPLYHQVWKWKLLPNGDKIKEYAKVRTKRLERFFPNDKFRRYDCNGQRWRDARKREQSRVEPDVGAKMSSPIIQLYPPRVGDMGVDAGSEGSIPQRSEVRRAPTGSFYNVHNTLVEL